MSRPSLTIDESCMRQALRLARRGFGRTSPNPMVGAILVRRCRIIGQGWHRRAGGPHAEIEALADAARRGHPPEGSTLYVTLEPCSTHGRTPPCTEAIAAAGIRRVVAAATDPNPAHSGRGFVLLRRRGVEVATGILAAPAALLNEAFNHWIVRRTPFVTVKAAMSLDGKIATASGESKWITGPRARAHGMKLRQGADAILTGVNTILADDPALTFRGGMVRSLRRIILDSHARIPLRARVIRNNQDGLTAVVVTRQAAASKVRQLRRRVRVIVAPSAGGRVSLPWLLRRLGRENVTSLLVEGGGEINASFLMEGLAQRVAFFYAPVILGGRTSVRGVAGKGIADLKDRIRLEEVKWRRLGCDLLMTAHLALPVAGVADPGGNQAPRPKAS